MNNRLFFFKKMLLTSNSTVVQQFSEKQKKKQPISRSVTHSLVAFKPIQPNQMECVLALFQATGKVEINLLT